MTAVGAGAGVGVGIGVGVGGWTGRAVGNDVGSGIVGCGDGAGLVGGCVVVAGAIDVVGVGDGGWVVQSSSHTSSSCPRSDAS